MVGFLPSCCKEGTCLIYNWSPNCSRLFSRIDSMSDFESDRTAIAARRMPTASPTPAPDKLVSHEMSCNLRFLSLEMISSRYAAAPATKPASTLHHSRLSVTSPTDKYLFDRAFNAASKTIVCSKSLKLSSNALNCFRSLSSPSSRAKVSARKVSSYISMGQLGIGCWESTRMSKPSAFSKELCKGVPRAF